MVNLLRYIWKNLHLPKKIYTGTARGARDKYQVCTHPNPSNVSVCSLNAHLSNAFASRLLEYFHHDDQRDVLGLLLMQCSLKPPQLSVLVVVTGGCTIMVLVVCTSAP